MPTYNGHRSWNAWNVALWIGNDEGLYRLALYHMAREPFLWQAAKNLLADLPGRTPDGARYNVTCLIEALKGLRE